MVRNIGLFATVAICGMLISIGIGSAQAQAQAPTSAGQGTLICHEGSNRMEFRFEGKGRASLTRIEGSALRLFTSLHEQDWTVQVIRPDGVPQIRLANAKGAALTFPGMMTGETYGRMTWNEPPNSKADFLCDLSLP